MDITKLSDEELQRIASAESDQEPDISSMSDEELNKIATQESIDSGADKVRSAIGKVVTYGGAAPAVIGAELAMGRLGKPDPLSDVVGNIVDGAVQSTSFGIPKSITKRILESNGLSYPENKDKSSENVGKIIGLLAPGRVAQSIVTKLPGMAGQTIAKGLMRGATEGAIVGFTESPDDFLDIQQRIKQAQIGAVVGGVAVPVGEAISKVSFKSAELAKSVRNSLFESKRSIGTKFESQLSGLIESNPSKVISLEEPFTVLKEASKSNSRLIQDIRVGAKKAGLDPKVVQGFIDDPSTASQMTLNQTREIKQAISNIPSIKSNYAKGKFANFSDTDIDLIDFADNIKKEQLGVFPELQQINQTYSDKLAKYNMVKDKFKVGRLLDNMEKNFGDSEVRNIVNELLPKETISAIGGYRSAMKLIKAAGWLSVAGLTGLGGAVGYQAYKAVAPR